MKAGKEKIVKIGDEVAVLVERVAPAATPGNWVSYVPFPIRTATDSDKTSFVVTVGAKKPVVGINVLKRIKNSHQGNGRVFARWELVKEGGRR